MAEQDMTPEQVAQLKEKLKSMSPEQIRELQKQNCIFCQIISGKIPAKKVYEDDKCLAFLDIYPSNPGHVLLVPKEHYMIMPQVSEPTLQHLFIAAKHISHAILRGLKATGVNIFVANGAVAGQRAQHFIVHVIPRKEDDGLQFDLTEHDLDDETKKKLLSIFKQKEETKELPKTGKEELKAEKESEFTEQIAQLQKELKEKAPKRKEKKTKTKKEKPKEETKKGEVSLDDIAGLFS